MADFYIVTDRLVIRNMEEKDLDDFFLYRSNPEITEFQSFDPMTKDESRSFIDRQKEKTFGKPGEWVQYSIENTQTGQLIGDCAIKLDAFDPRMAEIGITISHLHQKKGNAREALNGVIDFLFSLEGFHRIVELVDTRNEASIKMLESVGFRREGHFAQSYFDKGIWTDEFQYAMLRSDWEKREK